MAKHIMMGGKPYTPKILNWPIGTVEALLVLVALAFALIAAFLAPSQRETLATLASSRQIDFALAITLALLALALAVVAEMLRRRLRASERSRRSPGEAQRNTGPS